MVKRDAGPVTFTPPATEYAGVQIGSAPAMATFPVDQENTRLYIAFQANDPSHSLFVTSSPDGRNFITPAQAYPGIQIGGAPAMAAFNNRLYIAFQANDPSNQLFVTSSADGVNFTTPARGYPGIQIGSAPAMAAFNNRLFIAFRADDPSNALFLTSSADGVNFTTPTHAPGHPGLPTWSPPAMTVFNNQLYISFFSPRDDPDAIPSLTVIASLDGVNFNSIVTADFGIQLSTAPAMTALGNRLYISFQGNDHANHALSITSSTDGVNFSATEYPGILLGSAPASGEFDQKLFVAFQANDPSHILFVAASSPV